jgi:hypothetical protein
LNEIDLLRSAASQLKTQLLERKAEEELKLNEKMKEIASLQRQFHDAVV